ncbi:MAG: MFS transporter, partial [Gammaproteobacteria bacterium]|nr:MFS transporter [Gammaproteobacteria bacterium]
GLGFGPTLVALLTDYYFQSQADLRYSLALATACCAVTASMAIFVGIRGYRDSLQRAKQWR